MLSESSLQWQQNETVAQMSLSPVMLCGIFLGNPEAFPVQTGFIIPAVCSGSVFSQNTSKGGIILTHVKYFYYSTVTVIFPLTLVVLVLHLT